MTTKRKRSTKSISYKKILFKELQNPELAAGYLTEAFEEGEDVFLLALKDVTEAHGGIGPLARITNLNREGLYEMLSKQGNPRLSSFSAILKALGIKVTFNAKLQGTKAA